MSVSTLYPSVFPYVYDGSAQPLMSMSSESVLPPAYADSQASTFEQSVSSPPYSPRPLPRLPTSTIASVLSPVHTPRVASSPIDLTVLFDDDIPDPILPPDDVRSFVPSDSDSDSESDITLQDDLLLEVRPVLQLSTAKIVDSTLSPVDPECLHGLDMALVASPLDAWADVCYADSIIGDATSDDHENDMPYHQRSDSRHAFASRVNSPRVDDSMTEHALLPPRTCTLSPTPVDMIAKPMSPPPDLSSPSSPPLSYSPSLSRSTPTLASPLTSDDDADADDEDDGAHADDEGDGGRGHTDDPHVGLRGWAPPRVWAGYEVWVPVADVEEKIAALHVDLNVRSEEILKGDLDFEKTALPHRVQFNMRPTSPVPGYPLLFSREPPNPGGLGAFLPEEV
ncbi:hypothetical protein EVJ58_g7930 [Rhodofomes roseus]|uniref:Uncharacterized protein n=1 Tax=Rhodofomes roseus TaxID=34475 RepID=A0A4Y9Y0J5_9APHY|nr:hypothetical protein EVJ58_g7930 [Rhodofomes roseus]